MQSKHMEDDTLVIVFIKNPIIGKVKTRLAKEIGAEGALKIYHRLLDHTRQLAAQSESVKEVWYSDFIDESDDWGRSGFSRKIQPKGNLGDRMSEAFRKSFASGYNRVVLIGSDCPGLESDHLKEAFGQLSGHDVVLGPANDGGYYLVGLSSMIPSLFQNKPWSQPELYAETLSCIQDHSLSLFELPVLNDVDTLADLRNENMD